MTELRLVLSGLEFSISAPQEVCEQLRQFYPRSLVSRPPRRLREPRPRARFSVEYSGNAWSLSRDDRALGSFAQPGYALLALEYQIEEEMTAVDDGRIAIHAGAVETGSGGWLIAGNPDTGKTSSTFQLLQLEQPFLCEEIALYDPATRAVHPYPQTLALDRRYIEEFESRFAVENGTLVPLDENIVRFVPDRFSPGPVPLGSLLLPRFRPGKRPHIRELEPQDVLTEVLGYCFRPSAGEERLFDVVIDLLEHTRLLRVTYGDLSEARDLYRQLLDSRVR